MKRILLALLASASIAAHAVTVVDDTGRSVTLAHPAQRVISMAPHITELLFAAGGGARIVGAMNFSDYPAAAKTIPLVGSNSQIDLERVIALKPDLVVVWESGNTARQVEQLASLDIPVFHSEPRTIDKVADSLLRLGRLLGTDETARAAAAAMRAKVAVLEQRYARHPTVRVFYQVWDRPLYTLSGQQVASDAIRLCGGENIFAGLRMVAPQVSTEAVLQQDPEAIVAPDQHDPGDRGLSIWKQYPMTAVRHGNLFTVRGELLTRPGPRIVDGAAELCAQLELARRRRP